MGARPEKGDEAFEWAPPNLALVDVENGRIMAVNRALAQLLGMEPADLVGLVWPTPLGGSRDDLSSLLEQVRGRERVVVETRMGDRIDPVWWRQTAVRVQPDDGPPYLIVQVEDRTREHHINRELTRAADHDELTGLWNRRKFRRELRAALGPSQRGSVGLLLFDVDGFKQVNDTYGHTVGDAALVAVAAALMAATPVEVGVARLSGDEFAAVVRATGSERASALCAQLAARVERVHVGEGLPHIELSAGWAVGAPGDDPDRRVHDLMIEADVAMYATKARARAQRSASFGPASGEQAVADAWSTGGEVHESGYELWSHPVVEVASGRAVMHDIALHGGDSPVTLTALVRIIEMVERHAGRQVGQPLSYLVHLPQFPLGVGSAVKWLSRAAHDSGIDPSLLTFGFPEHQLVSEGRAANQVLATLRSEGFGLAIDDFGAEVGSLRLLADLCPDQVWLHRSLLPRPSDGTDGSDADEVAGARGRDGLVDAVLGVARCASSTTGVAGASADQVDLLAAAGIDLVLVPDPAALRPVGVVALEGAIGGISVEAARPPAAGSTRGS